MELFLIFTGAFIVALSGALMPGPLLTVTVAESLKRGAKAGPLIIAGHAILEIALIILILFGFKNFLTLPGVTVTIFLIGGFFLIYTGIHLFYSLNAETSGRDKTKNKNYNSRPVLKGILVSLANPYWTIWWVTIGLGYIIKALKYNYAGIILFFSGHILADLAWYWFISFSVSRGSKKLISRGWYNKLIIGCGIFLILFGIWFIAGGINKLAVLL